ncbi:MAG: J domain-containing protein [Sphingobacteriaceae bacterium]|nr:J domain-containing protein [Sphingobacteriaceae bacterium]
MINYYEILGVKENATAAEIKAAFRKLAKLFHPDKNPNGQDQFRKIRKAYEILGNPSLRRSYDLKLKYYRNSNTKTNYKKPGTKNWSFEEQELKRRKYYDEHIRKYAKTNPIPKVNPNEIKTNYNEYKYILFATPLAVALFLLIVNLSADSKPPIENTNPIIEASFSGLKMGDSPYQEHFGKMQYNLNAKVNLTIKNQTGNDAVFLLFNEKEFVRSVYIADGFLAEITQLPGQLFNIRYSLGKNWKPSKINKANKPGGFTQNKEFYKNDVPFEINALNELTLVSGINEGFTKINEQEFFDKKNYD